MNPPTLTTTPHPGPTASGFTMNLLTLTATPRLAGPTAGSRSLPATQRPARLTVGSR